MNGIRRCQFCKQEIFSHEKMDIDNARQGAYTVWHYAHARCADKVIIDNFRLIAAYIKLICSRFKE